MTLVTVRILMEQGHKVFALVVMKKCKRFVYLMQALRHLSSLLFPLYPVVYRHRHHHSTIPTN